MHFVLNLNNTAYFPRSSFVKDSKRMKAFFFQKKYSVFIKFSNFSNSTIFWFFFRKKTSQWRRKWYHLIRIIQQICHLYRFWKKKVFQKPIYCLKKNKFRTYLRNLTISVAHSTANFLQFGGGKFKSQNRWDMGHFQLARKRKKSSRWVDDFPSILSIWQKIIISCFIICYFHVLTCFNSNPYWSVITPIASRNYKR